MGIIIPIILISIANEQVKAAISEFLYDILFKKLIEKKIPMTKRDRNIKSLLL